MTSVGEGQVAILGTGSPALERKVKGLQGLYPGKLSVTVNFDTPLAHKLFAGTQPPGPSLVQDSGICV